MPSEPLDVNSGVVSVLGLGRDGQGGGYRERTCSSAQGSIRKQKLMQCCANSRRKVCEETATLNDGFEPTGNTR